jgi:hypothetical protein
MLCQAHWIDKVIETFRKWQFQYLLNIIVKLVTINYRIRQKRFANLATGGGKSWSVSDGNESEMIFLITTTEAI